MSPARIGRGMEARAVKTFYGQKSDRAGTNKKIGHFNSLQNCFSELDQITMRFGHIKYQGKTNATGSKTRGLYNPEGLDNIDMDLVKMVSGRLSFYAPFSGKWILHDSTDFENIETWMAEGPAEDSGPAAAVSDTTGSSSTSTLINLVSGGLTVNAHVGQVVKIIHSTNPLRYEKKIIASNDADSITLSIQLDEIPADGAGLTVEIRDITTDLFIATVTELHKLNAGDAVAGISGSGTATGLTRLDTNTNTPAFTGIEVHDAIMCAWTGNRVHLSDVGLFETYKITNFLSFASIVLRVKSFTENVFIVYEKNRITACDTSAGYTESDIVKTVISTNEGTAYPKTVANYNSPSYAMQLYVSNPGKEVKAITAEMFRNIVRETKTRSLTDLYINDEITALTPVCAEVSQDGHYMLAYSNGDRYRLNVDAYERTGFREVIWSKDVLPTAGTNQTPNVVAITPLGLAWGPATDGQIRLSDAPGIYTDDGVAIDYIINRRSLQFDSNSDVTHYHGLNISHGTGGATATVSAFFVTDNTPAGAFGAAVATYTTASEKEHNIRIPNNPSGSKSRGKRLDWQLTFTSSTEVAPIESLEYIYYPGRIS